MSHRTQAAHDSYDAALQNARDLIAIHKALSARAGRRRRELSLNRGAVVLSVAAWQTFVEQLTLAILAELAPPATYAGAGVYRLLAAAVEGQVRRLNTPNAANSLETFRSVNFDPTPVWNLTISWERQSSAALGSLRDEETFNPHQARQELDSWLLIRHKIAHGDVFSVEPRFANLVTGHSQGRPTLLRRNADRCISFFEQIALATSTEADRQFP